MRSWGEFVDFVRGTRPRPPPGPRSPLATMLLVAASLAHLPLVYLLVARGEVPPAVALSVGLLAIGLAWCGGVSLEGRRRGTVQLLAAFGVAEASFAFVPWVAEAAGVARWLFVAIGALCFVAFLAVRRAR